MGREDRYHVQLKRARNADDPLTLLSLRRQRSSHVTTYHSGTPSPEVGWYELKTPLTHSEIASMITATRVSVSQALAVLRREGLVIGSRGEYRLNTAGLEALLES